jgi:quercetin dioxygenase-like cupin family protein
MAITSARALGIEGYGFATMVGPRDRPAAGEGKRSVGPARTVVREASHLMGIICRRTHRVRSHEFTRLGNWVTAVRGFAAVTAFLATTTAPAAAGDAAMEVGADRAALALLPADHPEGTDAAVKLVSLKRAENLHHPTVSTFVVDYRPGGSAMLHRRPSPGYVLVYVLSGSIQAEAWSARIGIYHAGDTWAEPAFANNIISRNASATEPARALVVLVAGEVEEYEPE